MSEIQLDQDEIVYVDQEDGLGFSRADFPAFDYPQGTVVALAGVTEVKGTVVAPQEASGHPGDGGPMEWLPVRWNGGGKVDRDPCTWIHADGVVKA